MKKSLLAVPALLGAAALTFAGCAKPADSGSGSSAAPSGAASANNSNFIACMVSDEGGFDDKSFNETSYQGMVRAKNELGVTIKEIESKTQADFGQNIQAMVDQKCNIIVTVGFMLGDATLAAGQKNPDVKFAIVDESLAGKNKTDNIKPLVFNSAQPSFLAGYLAAGMTKTGVVGTFGGAKIPTVTIFMDGFAQGVDQYNKDNNTQVRVEGWDVASQDGQFVGDFSDVARGKVITQDLISKGADIVFPVAGPVGTAALEVAKSSGGKVNAIWVDADGYVSAPDYKGSIMTSVVKGMDVAVFDAIKAALDGTFTGDPFIGTFANEGVSLAPFHDFDAQVPQDLKNRIEELRKGIIDGSITIESAAQPK